ncbi:MULTISPECIES: ATP-binding protein [unclassified Treponema]|uniref:ATP-binding protein n=1 Tax=unclassified Treponema TaxID=2638727 RepID=UPI0020A54B5A|nr:MULTISPECIES: ATP-binding protein [unclassified Treponema]UTC66518.1 ATP-binding protein [Treponema sp. OMZ 789]UTC69250.1 ATP-binding protein [Treponema sp. OMZ 790]UTC71963.1 ATP-binding protein [Treponema sp. OMZ 791]
MNLYRKLPIGVQSFEDLRKKNFLYADKTEYVFRLANFSKVYFLSRPRRFGKSLFLSTLEAYFLGKKELFNGLYIEKAEEERAKAENSEPWIEYPVLYLDFNIGKYDEKEGLNQTLNYLLTNLERIYGSNKTDDGLSARFAGIISRAYEKTGRQVVILVDEYDKPLLQTMSVNETLNEEFRSTLKSFYSVIKTCDKYIRFAFLTGVTKFSKVSIFSDLNNLQDISLHEDCSALCGITQEELTAVFSPEIQVLADKEKISFEECLILLKKRYDGYLFAKEGRSVYNPFSLLNAFSAKDVGSYWFATGTPTFLVNYLKDAHYNIPDLDGNVELDEAGLADYRADKKNPLPILFQSGYLTIKEYIREAALYRLGFPNDEVRYGFFKNLLPDYTSLRTDQTASSVWRFTEDVKNGNVAGFMERMQSIIAGVPYDNLPKDKLKLREQNYQTAVYLIFKLMGQFVETEVHCAAGRADSIVHTKDTIYIFEFKLAGNGSAEDAIAQIKEKGYVVPFKSSGKKIVLIGSSFDEKERTIKDWKYETFDNQ